MTEHALEIDETLVTKIIRARRAGYGQFCLKCNSGFEAPRCPFCNGDWFCDERVGMVAVYRGGKRDCLASIEIDADTALVLHAVSGDIEEEALRQARHVTRVLNALQFQIEDLLRPDYDDDGKATDGSKP